MRTGNNAGFQIHKMVEFEETALDVKGRFRAVETVVGDLATAAEKMPSLAPPRARAEAA